MSNPGPVSLSAQPDQTELENNLRRWRNLLEVAAYAACAVLNLYLIWQLLVRVWDVDFIQFELAIKSLLAGISPYEMTYNGKSQFYPYPLWTSFYYLPIAGLEHTAAIRAWLILNILLLFPVTYLLKAIFLPGLKPLSGVPLYCLALTVCTINLLDGFPNIIILGWLALSLWSLKRGQNYRAGVWAALGLLIKPHLTVVVGLIFVLWLFLGTAEQRKSILKWWVGAAATTTGTLLVSLLVEPLWIPKLLARLKVSSMTGGVQENGLYYEWITSTFLAWFNYITGFEDWALILPYLLFSSLAVALSVIFALRNRPVPEVWFSLAVGLNFAITPYARPYDFPLLLIPIFYLLAQALRAFSSPARPLGGYLIMAGLALALLLPVFNGDFRWFYFQPLIIIILLIICSGRAAGADYQQTKKVFHDPAGKPKFNI